jgi:hypothetical protein
VTTGATRRPWGTFAAALALAGASALPWFLLALWAWPRWWAWPAAGLGVLALGLLGFAGLLALVRGDDE